MINIITKLADRETEINKVKNVYIGLPDSEPEDLAAAFAASIFFDTRLFSSSRNSSLDMTRKLCSEFDHGVSIYKAYRLTQALGYEMNLDRLRVILFSILSAQIREPLDLATLDGYAFTLSKTFEKVLTGNDHDAGIIACALLTLAGREENDRFNFAYDTLLPALLEDQNFSNYDTEKNIVYALDILWQADCDLRAKYSDLDVDYFVEDAVLYRALLIAVLADFMGDDLYKLYTTFSSLDTDLAESLLQGKCCYDPEESFSDSDCETQDHDPLDDLDWDEFFSDAE
ncbi:MAG: hypothetical protein IJ645_07880 [Ruminococcus sp.]|nr:hypothetical protein [Ruminococcus sp.]